MTHAYVLIENLKRVAVAHAAECISSECGVSLIQLRQTCSMLKVFAEPSEIEELDKMTADWPS